MPSYLSYKRIVDGEQDITWITTENGTHVPIKPGQNKEDAIESFFESKSKGGRTGTETKPVVWGEYYPQWAQKVQQDFEKSQQKHKEGQARRDALKDDNMQLMEKVEKELKNIYERRQNPVLYKKSELEGVERYPDNFGGFKTNNNKYPLSESDYEYKLRSIGINKNEFYKKLGNPKINSLLDKFSQNQNELKELSRGWMRAPENPTVLMIKNGWANSVNNLESSLFSDNEKDNLPYGYAEPLMKTIRAELKKMGWKPYHSSGKRVASSSSYYEKNGETLRLSDHELPMTPERRYNTEMGYRKGWAHEIILDEKTMRKFAIQPTREQFLKVLENELESE